MSYLLMTKSGEIQFPLNISSEMGIYKSLNENSFCNELFSRPPYPLTLEVDDLIAPSNPRKAKKHQKNPYLSPPRPQNSFFLFRRDFAAKLKQKGVKLKNSEISQLAAAEWHKQPQNVLCFFEVLENLAKEKHSQLYPNYKFTPRKEKSKNSEKSPKYNVTDNLSEQKCLNSEEISSNLDTSKNNSLSEISDQSLDQGTFDISDFIEFDPITF
ncbi:23529_t:CDS:1 [Cetraspora pellucida]|uniref:23529_t:CDS:1 n=1 Tax=Cetraspora pellucida TaxID=1433469 RepID=A0A9N9C809_9GLOM|nr:23529_t:CDS:1 [Cetraspora pellucida]